MGFFDRYQFGRIRDRPRRPRYMRLSIDAGEPAMLELVLPLIVGFFSIAQHRCLGASRSRKDRKSPSILLADF
jgi:hypothetical protein